MKPEEFGEVSNIIKRSDCDKKDEATGSDARKEPSQEFQRTLEIFHDIG